MELLKRHISCVTVHYQSFAIPESTEFCLKLVCEFRLPSIGWQHHCITRHVEPVCSWNGLDPRELSLTLCLTV